MASYEILIADDHPLFRSALHQALTLGLAPTCAWWKPPASPNWKRG